MIDFYYWPTGNGLKIGILLEELALPYRTIAINIREGEQKQAAFQRISANGRIAAIVDPAPLGLSEPLSLFALDLAIYPHIHAWRERIKARPAVQRAYTKGRDVAAEERSLALQ